MWDSPIPILSLAVLLALSIALLVIRSKGSFLKIRPTSEITRHSVEH